MARRDASLQRHLALDQAHTIAVYRQMKAAEPALFDEEGETVMARMVCEACREDLRNAGVLENEMPRTTNALADLHRLFRVRARAGIRSAAQLLGDVRDSYRFARAARLRMNDEVERALLGGHTSTATEPDAAGGTISIETIRDAMEEMQRQLPGTLRRSHAGTRYHHNDIYAEMMASLFDDEEPNVKADALLKAWLSPAQAEQYAKQSWFDVRGSDTGRTYRIFQDRSYNVRGDDGAHYCFGPAGVPLGDMMLAQKIALETMESEALKVANVRSEAMFAPLEIYRDARVDPPQGYVIGLDLARC